MFGFVASYDWLQGKGFITPESSISVQPLVFYHNPGSSITGIVIPIVHYAFKPKIAFCPSFHATFVNLLHSRQKY